MPKNNAPNIKRPIAMDADHSIDGIESSESYQQLYKQFTDAEPQTEAVLKRQFTDNELKELCMRKKCKVVLPRWNIVKDYEDSLRRKGRLQNKTSRQAKKLILKAVNRHIQIKEPYTEEKIQKRRAEEWFARKKDNIMSLELWEYDRKKREKTIDATENLTEMSQEVSQETQEEVQQNSESPTLVNPLVILEQQIQQEQNECTPTSQDILIADLLNINTESMSIATGELTLNVVDTENNNESPTSTTGSIRTFYQEFTAKILSTSTQSQEQQNECVDCTQSTCTEEIIVD